jgi:hypothetical protein
MSNYFDRVEQELREAVRRRAHVPWHVRLRPPVSRPVVVVVACLVAAGSALAATGVFRTGAPVGADVTAVPDAREGVVIPRSVHLLSLRVPDPNGGPPWGLRVARTTRGLMCAQFGRVVSGRLGVLGQDGVFADDGAFHPLSADYLNGIGCGTEDAYGHAFVNEQMYALAASALIGERQHASGGCYTAAPAPRACPPGDLRDVLFGLLGPDAVSVTHVDTAGGSATIATAGGDGAYLVVLPHTTTPCAPPRPSCRIGQGGVTVGPELEASEVIRAVSYRDGRSCRLLTPVEVAHLQAAEDARFRAALRARYPKIYRAIYRSDPHLLGSLGALTSRERAAYEALRSPYLRAANGKTCPSVGYMAKPVAHFTPAQIASPIRVRAVPARFYCEKPELTVPCNTRVPRGYRRLDISARRPQLLLLIEFTARAAVTNFDSHYEINMSTPDDRGNPACPAPGGGSFGPTQVNLRAGQRVRYSMFVNPRCRGVSHIRVGFVTVVGPSGSMPVPGLPGQSAEIPVGHLDFTIP